MRMRTIPVTYTRSRVEGDLVITYIPSITRPEQIAFASMVFVASLLSVMEQNSTDVNGELWPFIRSTGKVFLSLFVAFLVVVVSFKLFSFTRFLYWVRWPSVYRT